MRVPRYLLTVFSLVLFLSPVKSQSWEPLGPTEENEASLLGIIAPAIATSGTTPYIAYRQTQDGKLSVRKFNGITWEFVGQPGITVINNTSNAVSIATDVAGAPYIAYGDVSNGNKVTVKKYDGSSWVDVGTPTALTGATTSNCALVIASDGTIYVAFPDAINGNKLGVSVKHPGTDWQNLTPGGISVASVFAVSIDLDNNGNLYIAFADISVSNAVTVMEYTGSSFAVVGAAGISNGNSNYYISVVVDAGGVPYVAFAESRNGNRLAVKKFEGGNWVYAGSPGISTAALKGLMIKADASGNKYVVYNAGATYVKKFDATTTTWIDAGNTVSANGANFTGIALDATGVPYIIYTIFDFANRAVVKKLTGNTWTSVGTRGIANGGVRLPFMTTNSIGLPYTIYYDTYSSNVVVKKWDGSNWIQVGSGLSSQSGGYPYIAMDAKDVPYIYYVNENQESVVRKFDGSDWVAMATPTILPVNGGFSCSFSVSPDGIPYLAFMGNPSVMMNVMKIDGGSWVAVGVPDFSIDIVGYVSMTLDASGIPYVIYSDAGLGDKATVKKFDGSNWVDVGSPGISTGFTTDSRLTIDRNGTLYAAYNDNGAVVKKFDGSNWVNVGVLDAGITFQELAVNDQNVPYIMYRSGSALGLKKFDGSNWVEVGQTGINSNVITGTGFVFDGGGKPVLLYTNGGVYAKSFGPFVILPLHLTAFNGRIDNKDALLHWQSEEEINTRSFIIERSIDGHKYNAIGTVAALNESGVHQYSFVDKNVDQLGASVIYYRLKLVDIDGRSTYSHVLMLPVKPSANNVTCYPNPVISETNLNITLDKGENVQARIFDNLGRVIQVQHWQLPAGTTAVPVNMSQLVKGLYHLEISGRSIKKQVSLIKL